MPDHPLFTINYKPEHHVIIVRFTEKFDSQINISAFMEAIELCDISRTNFLWDLRAVSFSNFALSEIKKLRDFRVRYAAERANTKSCSLVDDSIKRALMALYDEVNLGVGPRTEVFLTEREARAYLGLPADLPLSPTNDGRSAPTP